MNIIDQIIPTVVSGVILSGLSVLVGYFFRKYQSYKKEHETLAEIKKSFNTLLSEHRSVMKLMRDLTRVQIVDICEAAIYNGFIYENQLKCLCDIYAGYKQIDENTYTDELYEHVTRLPIKHSAKPASTSKYRNSVDKEGII